ncbi:MAG: hypothetical protein IJJ41_00190 [Clostridia bacterium]|nr:hypothetical protein [Clostridia bacterium]
MEKKKKILIIALVVCLVLAAGSITAALLMKNRSKQATTSTASSANASQADKDTNASSTTVSQEDAKGIEYVKDAYKEEYQSIASSGIKGEPDSKVKACFFNKAKEASPELKMKNFDLLKVYEGFRIYDTTGTTNAEGTQHFLLLVYCESGKAVIVHYEEYAETEERAKLLTDYIQEFDKDYERYAKQAKSLDGEYILYE